MAGRRGQRVRRGLKAVAVLGLTAVVLTVEAQPSGPTTPATAAFTAVSASAPGVPDDPPFDLGRVRVELPRGYRAPTAVPAGPAPAGQPVAPTSAPASAPTRAPANRPAPAPAPAPAVVPAPRPTGAVLPLRVDVGASTQAVTVVAPSARSTTAQLTAWELGPAGWRAVLGPISARIGSGGVGAASERTTRTPAGTFSLSEAFGRAANPGSGLPYRVLDGQDWWVSDVGSPLYNQHARCDPGTCPFDEAAGENLLAAGAVYDHAVVIDYNRRGVPGAGSAFFLHVTNGAATAGCVAVPRGSLVALLRWLDPDARPLIAIGVG